MDVMAWCEDCEFDNCLHRLPNKVAVNLKAWATGETHIPGEILHDYCLDNQIDPDNIRSLASICKAWGYRDCEKEFLVASSLLDPEGHARYFHEQWCDCDYCRPPTKCDHCGGSGLVSPYGDDSDEGLSECSKCSW